MDFLLNLVKSIKRKISSSCKFHLEKKLNLFIRRGFTNFFPTLSLVSFIILLFGKKTFPFCLNCMISLMNLFLPSQSGFRWLRLCFLNLFQTFSLVRWSLNCLNMLLKIRSFKENLYRMVSQGKFSSPFMIKYVHFLRPVWLGSGAGGGTPVS